MSDYFAPYLAVFVSITTLAVSIAIYGIICMAKEAMAYKDSSLKSNYMYYYRLSILAFITHAIFSVVVLSHVIWLYVAYDDYFRDLRDYGPFPLQCLHMFLWHISKIFILWLCNARLFYTFNGMSANMQISFNFYITMNVLSAVSMLVLCSISVYGYASTTSPYLRRVGMDGSRVVFTVLMICILVLFNKRLYLRTNERKTVRMHHIDMTNLDAPISITDDDNVFVRSVTGRDSNTFKMDANMDDIYILLDVITRYSILVTVWCITMITLIIFWDIVFAMKMKGVHAALCYWAWTAVVDSFCVLCLYEPNTERIDCYKLWFKCNDDPKCNGLSIHYLLDKTCVNCAKKYGVKKKNADPTI